MKLISFFPNPVTKGNYPADIFENAFGDFFNSNFPVSFKGNGFHKSPAVNVIETDGAYTIEVAAPGLSKEDFEVKLDKDLLTVSAKKEETKEESGKYTRREFSYLEFTRTFTVPDTVVADGIKANYENGVLRVDLAKKAEAKPQSARTIEIG